MKRQLFTIIYLVTLSLLLGCGSTKKVIIEEQAGTEEVILPLTGKEYESNSEFYRAKASGKSTDIATARKIALNNAKAEIAGLINAKIKAVTDNYTNQRSTTENQDFENKFENLSREVVSQQLSDVSIIGEKLLKSGSSYEFWLAIEISKQAILNGINNSISNNQKLQIDYDKKKFEEIYNQEMSKMENGGL